MRDRRVLVAVAVAYVVAVVVLVVGPWGRQLNDATVACYDWFRYHWPLAPLWALPEHYGVLLNVALFVPAGALLVALTPCRWWGAVVLAAAASGAIELAQARWLDRIGEWSDVGANTLGAAIGALAVTLLSRRRSRRAGPPASPRRR
ncbi:VanZ family protein [Nocardioides sp. Soil774]|uniref:VanZ family protein n=1 Tax=Nocardioides sp. Soil774 TaxID=1736408 RepID=UPI0009E7B1AD|nr:VanZ family protein [Nocardioides sp. Soil774]